VPTKIWGGDLLTGSKTGSWFHEEVFKKRGGNFKDRRKSPTTREKKGYTKKVGDAWEGKEKTYAKRERTSRVAGRAQ